MKLLHLIAFACIGLLLCSHSLFATTYYISASGNDHHAGTSPYTAWASISKVNGARFTAGDSILFEGGSIFSGSLYFGPETLGTEASPLLISSYGNGRATISSGKARGLLAYNSAGFILSKLIFQGSGRTSNTTPGIDFYMDLPNTSLSYLYLDSLEVSGYHGTGILIGSWNGSSGYNKVTITNCQVHDNGEAGISTYAEAILGHKSFYLAYNKVFNISGIPERTDHHSGSGIVLGGVDGAVIEYCEAYNNGWLNAWKGGGPVGIWGYRCNNLVIQRNESHHNKTGTTKDGGGFDIDGGCTNCTIQYNYSHDNEGPGYLIAQYPEAPPMKGVLIRYNISENDARKNGYGAIHLWSSGANGGIQDAEIYNNTVYLTPTANGTPRAIFVQSGGVRNGRFSNNILQTTGGLELVWVDKLTDVRFEGNNYWSSGDGFKVKWGSTTYTSLQAWRDATSQERLKGLATGLFSDPQLSDPGKGGTISHPQLLNTLSGYELKPISSLIGKAINLQTEYGINIGDSDFWGNTLEERTDICVGAHQLTANSKACLHGGTIPLSFGPEAGGTYSGTGVVQSTYFNPALTGTGKHTLFYTYVDKNGHLQKTAHNLTVIDASLTEWRGEQTKNNDWFDSHNWSSCIPTALIDVNIFPAKDIHPIENEGIVPKIKNGRFAQAKNISTNDTLPISGNGTLEINGIYTGKGLASDHEATIIFKSKAGQDIPAGKYGKLVLLGSFKKRLLGDISVSKELVMGESKLHLGEFSLSLDSTASVSGASVSSYLVAEGNGKLVIKAVGEGRQAFFPVGTSSSYTPALLENKGVTDDFSLRMAEGVLENGISGKPISQERVNKTWHIDEQVPGGSEVLLSLQWSPADEQALFVRSNSYISHYENGKWSAPDKFAEYASKAAAADGLYSVRLHNITSFSPFAVSNGMFPLPVSLTYFEAAAQGTEVLLSWETSGELNNKGFAVEVSTDGTYYRPLGFIASKGTNSRQQLKYSFRDTEKNKYGIRYYRLRQQDIDGTGTYSAIKAVNFALGMTAISVYPNPFTNDIALQLQATSGEVLQLNMQDMMGRLILSKIFGMQEGTNKINLSLDKSLPAGLYMFTVRLGNTVTQLRVVKK